MDPRPRILATAFAPVPGTSPHGAALMAMVAAVRAEIDAVLTPEQKAKLDGWIAAHRQMRGGLRGGPPPN